MRRVRAGFGLLKKKGIILRTNAHSINHRKEGIYSGITDQHYDNKNKFYYWDPKTLFIQIEEQEVPTSPEGKTENIEPSEGPLTRWLSMMQENPSGPDLSMLVHNIPFLVNENYNPSWPGLNDIFDELSKVYDKCDNPGVDLTHWEIVKPYLCIWGTLHNRRDLDRIEVMGSIEHLSKFIEKVIPTKENHTLEQNKGDFYRILKEILRRYEGNDLSYPHKRKLPPSLLDLFIDDLLTDWVQKRSILQHIDAPPSRQYVYDRLKSKYQLSKNPEEKEKYRFLLMNPPYAGLI